MSAYSVQGRGKWVECSCHCQTVLWACCTFVWCTTCCPPWPRPKVYRSFLERTVENLRLQNSLFLGFPPADWWSNGEAQSHYQTGCTSTWAWIGFELVGGYTVGGNIAEQCSKQQYAYVACIYFIWLTTTHACWFTWWDVAGRSSLNCGNGLDSIAHKSGAIVTASSRLAETLCRHPPPRCFLCNWWLSPICHQKH